MNRSRFAFAFSLVAGGFAALSLLAGAARAAEEGDGAIPPMAGPFDPELPVRIARALAQQPPREPEELAAGPLTEGMDYDTYYKIKFRDDHALWRDDGPYRVDLFHSGFYFRQPVRLFEVRDGQAAEIGFSPDAFDYPSDEIRQAAATLSHGIAGFRIMYAADWERDVLSFLGASYFRAVGGSKQFGASARGLAINTSSFGKEEFPRFTAFWLEKPVADSFGDPLVVHALLESDSVTGAYRFATVPGGDTVIDVRATLFARKDVADAGIAPLTSMYLYGENDQRMRAEYRPEIHDSDGLHVITGKGESIWRPLANPLRPFLNLFVDSSPRGFGLMQRDRTFDHYQDDGVYYEKRPDVWVEPEGDWGKGSVALIELPAHDESQDNIVAYWRPEGGLKAGEEREFRYRLHWGADAGTPERRVARVLATRTGLGGHPGTENREGRKFIVDFAGGPLPMMAKGAGVTPEITVSRGTVGDVSAIRVEEIGGWRVMFDLKGVKGADPVQLRAYLRLGNRALSETWLYHWWPKGE